MKILIMDSASVRSAFCLEYMDTCFVWLFKYNGIPSTMFFFVAANTSRSLLNIDISETKTRVHCWRLLYSQAWDEIYFDPCNECKKSWRRL